MKGISDREMRELMDAYIGEPEGVPPLDPEGQIAFIEEYFAAGAPELKVIFLVCNWSLRALSLLLKGRPFSRLGVEEQQELLNRVMSSRNPLLRGVGVLLGLPLLMSYYRRPEVAVPLGFDAAALKEESTLRVVTRDRDLPPKQGGQP
ncbi:MAG: hypothetical protein PHP28_09060 [Actinomycetota bacterium]|nr:hypothetical protein [Actinomycetota bacterium]MDD5667482.1 hypothetical protein [Actinomycetota bacterium]